MTFPNPFNKRPLPQKTSTISNQQSAMPSLNLLAPLSLNLLARLEESIPGRQTQPPGSLNWKKRGTVPSIEFANNKVPIADTLSPYSPTGFPTSWESRPRRLPSSINLTVKLSVIISALNEAESIQRAIETSLALSPREVIVADGGSSDDTVAIAQKLDCRVIECPRGRALQQNAGASASTGDVLLFLHADSWLVPEGRPQIERTLKSPSIPGGAFQHRIDTDGLLYRLVEAGDSLRVCCTRIAYGDQGIFLRRDVFEQLGQFPNVRLMEDVRLMKSLRDFGRLALLPGPLYVSARRWKKHGAIRQTLRNWCLLTAEQLGVHPDRLADLYAPHSNSVKLSSKQD